MKAEHYNSHCVLVVFYAGLVAVIGGAGGFLLGSYTIKRMSLTSGQQLRAIFFMSILCLGALFLFAVQCDTARLADDVSSRLHGQQTNG